jgi:hypothetical protein
MKSCDFELNGQLLIDENLAPQHDFEGKCFGFKLPDGRIVRMVMALEIENPDTGNFEYFSDCSKMESIGMTLLDYFKSNFTLI